MTVRAFEGQTPVIGPVTWVHRSADVFGDVSVGADFRERWTRFKAVYVDLARRYPEGLGPPPPGAS